MISFYAPATPDPLRADAQARKFKVLGAPVTKNLLAYAIFSCVASIIARLVVSYER